MRKWSERSLRNLNGLHPDLRRVFDRALIESPLDFIVTEGFRTTDRQRELVASGASQTMNSRHLTGHALDIAVTIGGRVLWDWPLYERVAAAVKVAADVEGVPITWGGDWKSFRDGPHYQLDWGRYPADDPWPVEGVPDDPEPAPSLWARIWAWIRANAKEPQT